MYLYNLITGRACILQVHDDNMISLCAHALDAFLVAHLLQEYQQPFSEVRVSLGHGHHILDQLLLDLLLMVDLRRGTTLQQYESRANVGTKA